MVGQNVYNTISIVSYLLYTGDQGDLLASLCMHSIQEYTDLLQNNPYETLHKCKLSLHAYIYTWQTYIYINSYSLSFKKWMKFCFAFVYIINS